MSEWNEDSFEEGDIPKFAFVSDDLVSLEYCRLFVAGSDFASCLSDGQKQVFIKKELLPLWSLWRERVHLFVEKHKELERDRDR